MNLDVRVVSAADILRLFEREGRLLVERAREGYGAVAEIGKRVVPVVVFGGGRFFAAQIRCDDGGGAGKLRQKVGVCEECRRFGKPRGVQPVNKEVVSGSALRDGKKAVPRRKGRKRSHARRFPGTEAEKDAVVFRSGRRALRNGEADFVFRRVGRPCGGSDRQHGGALLVSGAGRKHEFGVCAGFACAVEIIRQHRAQLRRAQMQHAEVQHGGFLQCYPVGRVVNVGTVAENGALCRYDAQLVKRAVRFQAVRRHAYLPDAGPVFHKGF